MCWKTIQEGSLENLCTSGVYVDTNSELGNCNTTYSRESHVMEESPSVSSSDIRQATSVPPWPKIKPIRAARADTGTFVDAEPDSRESAEFPWRWLGMLARRMIVVGSRWRNKWERYVRHESGRIFNTAKGTN